MRIHETTLNEVLDELPGLEPLEQACAAAYGAGDEPDLMIFVSGFEPRTAAVAAELARLGVTAPDACYLTYGTNEPDNEGRRPELLQRVTALANHVVAVDADSEEPAFAESLLRALAHAQPDTGRPLRVLLDVSVASGRVILRAMRTLFDAPEALGRDVDLTVAYAQAATYAPDQQEAERIIDALSTQEAAPGAIARTLGLDYDAAEHIYNINYPGQHLETLMDRAVIVCGFNHDRLRATLDHIDPNLNIEHPHPQATFFVGVPPNADDAWRHEAMVRVNGLDTDGAVDLHAVSTLDYKELLLGLEQVHQRSMSDGERLTLVPFGSKLQNVAAALFTEMRRDVRVILALPVRYKGQAYSDGVSELHALRFGSITAVRERLVSVGTLEVVDSPLRPSSG